MNTTLFIFVMFSLQAIYWLVGLYCSRNSEGKKDYFLAGKSVGIFPLMMTFFATQVGGGIMLGSADEAYRFGWPVIFYPLGVSLGLVMLGLGFGRRLAFFNVSTVAEILEVVYGSAKLRKLASILSIISLFMILTAQIIASQKFFISLGIQQTIIFVVFWAIVIFYTSKGGLKAVISTDMVQATFFSCILLFIFGTVYWSNPSIELNLLARDGNISEVSSKLCGWLLMPLLFMIIEQDMGQRCFAGASQKVVSQASLLAGIATAVVCVVPVFFGLLANSKNLQIPEGGSVLMSSIGMMSTPWMGALAGCAILAAIVSTATSLINAISSNLTADFAIPVKSMAGVKQMTSFVSVLALLSAFYFDTIVDLLIQSYELSVVCLFVPIIWGLFQKKGRVASATLAISFGVMGFILFRIFPPAIAREIGGLGFSFIGFVIGELIYLLNDKYKLTVRL